jgi:hypothetical protein
MPPVIFVHCSALFDSFSKASQLRSSQCSSVNIAFLIFGDSPSPGILPALSSTMARAAARMEASSDASTDRLGR